MGQLAHYLQQEFEQKAFDGWKCSYESPILSRTLEKSLGYKPRADILMQREDGSKRLWIELEISRADPVANHVKFATSHLFQPLSEQDVFVSMVSSHIDRGRRNLAANTILLMRHIGMKAFQCVLLPQFSGADIKRLNHSELEEIRQENIDVSAEIQRIFSITETILTVPGQRIHFAGDIVDVMRNLYRWNQEIKTPQGLNSWGKRTITYFVYDSALEYFAPSKFCAYTPIVSSLNYEDIAKFDTKNSEMSIDLYTQLDNGDRSFDGCRARSYLTQSLAMNVVEPNSVPLVASAFSKWLNNHLESIRVHPQGPKFLLPPQWFK